MIERLQAIIATLKLVLPANYDSMKFMVAAVNELEKMVEEQQNEINDNRNS